LRASPDIVIASKLGYRHCEHSPDIVIASKPGYRHCEHSPDIVIASKLGYRHCEHSPDIVIASASEAIQVFLPLYKEAQSTIIIASISMIR